jgi:AAA-like domain/CHAT domain
MAQTILILTANPQGTSQLRLDREVRDIEEGLQRAKKRDRFVLESKFAVRSRDIQRAMLDINPSIIHFSGHGTGDEGLVFEDETGSAKLVDGEALAGMFALFAEQVECVVLNGCYSEVQAEAISQHVNYTIGMKKAIGDAAAIEFAVGFYDALGSGKTIEFAYKFGCAAILLAGIPEQLTPTLKKKPNINEQTPEADRELNNTESDNLETILENIDNGKILDRAELEILLSAFQSGQITLATGDKAVSIGGSADGAVIITSDRNIIVNGTDATQLRESLGMQDDINQQFGDRQTNVINLFMMGSDPAGTNTQQAIQQITLLLKQLDNPEEIQQAYQEALPTNDESIQQVMDYAGMVANLQDAQQLPTFIRRLAHDETVPPLIREQLNQAIVAYDLESPEGQVSIDSPFYIASPYENRCHEEVKKPGSLIRIKSPHNMGKSSLMARVLDYSSKLCYRTVTIDLTQTNQKLFDDLDKFMQWFCASVGKQLGVRVKTEEYWDDIFGANDNSTDYFENYLLTEDDPPLVLAIDNFDRVFQHSDIETDFCGLLRGWYERSKTKKQWEKLRLLVVHSQEPYAQRDINQSPFNVGLPIELGEFTTAQVRELVSRHGLTWDDLDFDRFVGLIGGHPYLVRSALYYLASGDFSLDEFLKIAPTEAGIYSGLLRGYLKTLEDCPELGAAMKKVVDADDRVSLRTEESFKLDSMGLIVRVENDVIPRCHLYRQYFRERLGVRA